MTKSLNRLNKFNGIVFFMAFVAGLAAYAPLPATAEEPIFASTDITIHSGEKRHVFTVELATTPQQQERGLMLRTQLPEKAGMLFVFDPPQKVSMWMKNTLIPLDMIFADDTGKVIYIAEHTTPESEAPIGPTHEVAVVLELNAGAAKKYAMKIGDMIEYKNITDTKNE